jgi:aspartyl-tRNA(Asn)/glutamyl-tRNA(Gln) amidotransferase subunit A
MRYGARVEGRDLNGTYENTRASGFGAEVQRRILIGTYVLSAGYYDAYYLRAQKVRQRIAQDFRDAFVQVDAILTPATPSAAFALGEKSDDPVSMYLNDVFTVTANLAGLPALALPAATDKQGLPLGLQVIGKALDEESVFAVSAALEQAANFRAKPTKWWS